MRHIHLEAIARLQIVRVADQRAVTGAQDLDVRQLQQPAQRRHVAVDVAHDGGRVAQHGVAGEEDAVLLDVVAERIDRMARCGDHLDAHAAIEVQRLAIDEGPHALLGQAPAQQLDAVLGHSDLGLEMLMDVLEVARMVEMVVRDRRYANLRLIDRGQIAAQHPPELVDRLAGVDRQHLAAGLADDVDVRLRRPHRFVFGNRDDPHRFADLHDLLPVAGG